MSNPVIGKRSRDGVIMWKCVVGDRERIKTLQKFVIDMTIQRDPILILSGSTTLILIT